MLQSIMFRIMLILWVSTSLFAQSLRDIEKFKKEYETLQKAIEETPSVVETIDSETPTADIIKIPDVPKPTVGIVNYFGYDFFTVRRDLTIWGNLPVPVDYLLGPGDEIVVALWGETQIRSTYIISREGEIFVDKVGQVNLTGRRLDEAKKVLHRRLEQVYSTLKGLKASTFFDLSLGQLKSINVTFIGEVSAPGIHTVHPFSSVTTGLIQAGGVETTGSLRNIQVLRRGEAKVTLDMYELILEGKTVQDIRLQDQDIVFVPIRESTVTLEGEVTRPAVYEALLGESLSDLIVYAGGLTPFAISKVEVKRVIPVENRSNDDFAIEVFYIALSNANRIPVQNGDLLTIGTIPLVTRQVSVYGQVKQPGEYAYEDSMRVLDLLNLAGGINDETYWKSMYSTRAEIIRRDPDNQFPIVYLINLKKLRAGDQSQNKLLENWDALLVHQNPNFIPPKKVTITGEVQIAGVYVLERPEETFNDIIQRAGGFTENAFKDGIRMFRGGLQVVLKDYDILVNDGDSLYVPEHPGVVQVMGEVYNAGLVHYKKGKSLFEYVESAGGFTLNANKRNIAVVYANGDVKLKRFLSTPKVGEGATIVIYPKEEREPFNTTAFLTDVASITASLATIIYIISTQ
ncbi:MAG: SLBB domain-containing protein [Candidatus Marinimicrobia bacterium]|nr:SLBB domain-containing protein [Candidatus Neomarinimicrobiota bacterium]